MFYGNTGKRSKRTVTDKQKTNIFTEIPGLAVIHGL